MQERFICFCITYFLKVRDLCQYYQIICKQISHDGAGSHTCTLARSFCMVEISVYWKFGIEYRLILIRTIATHTKKERGRKLDLARVIKKIVNKGTLSRRTTKFPKQTLKEMHIVFRACWTVKVDKQINHVFHGLLSFSRHAVFSIGNPCIWLVLTMFLFVDRTWSHLWNFSSHMFDAFW